MPEPMPEPTPADAAFRELQKRLSQAMIARPTDRDILTAIFTLLGALAEKLTGQVVTVDIPHESGKLGVSGTVGVRPALGAVHWHPPDILPPTAVSPAT